MWGGFFFDPIAPRSRPGIHDSWGFRKRDGARRVKKNKPCQPACWGRWNRRNRRPDSRWTRAWRLGKQSFRGCVLQAPTDDRGWW